MNIDLEAGVLKPTGFWDPIGLATNADEATLKDFNDIVRQSLE